MGHSEATYLFALLDKSEDKGTHFGHKKEGRDDGKGTERESLNDEGVKVMKRNVDGEALPKQPLQEVHGVIPIFSLLDSPQEARALHRRPVLPLRDSARISEKVRIGRPTAERRKQARSSNSLENTT